METCMAQGRNYASVPYSGVGELFLSHRDACFPKRPPYSSAMDSCSQLYILPPSYFSNYFREYSLKSAQLKSPRSFLFTLVFLVPFFFNPRNPKCYHFIRIHLGMREMLWYHLITLSSTSVISSAAGCLKAKVKFH